MRLWLAAFEFRIKDGFVKKVYYTRWYFNPVYRGWKVKIGNLLLYSRTESFVLYCIVEFNRSPHIFSFWRRLFHELHLHFFNLFARENTYNIASIKFYRALLWNKVPASRSITEARRRRRCVDDIFTLFPKIKKKEKKFAYILVEINNKTRFYSCRPG